MEFEKGTIEFVRIDSASDDNTDAMFKLTLNGSNPIYVRTYTIFNTGNDVFFETRSNIYIDVISKYTEVMEYMTKSHTEELNNIRSEVVDSWYFSGYGSDFCILPNNSWNLLGVREDLREVAELIEDHYIYNHAKIYNEMEAKSERVEVADGYFKHKISHDDLMQIYKEIKERIETREQEKADKEKAETESIFAKAKETGEKQVLHKWSEPCNDPRAECDLDLCYEWAMPDGTTKYERCHTW